MTDSKQMQALRALLQKNGFLAAAEGLETLPPATAEARLIAWKRLAVAQRKAQPSAITPSS